MSHHHHYHSGRDSYARERIDDLNHSMRQQNLQSRQSRRRRALSDLELEERIVILEKTLIGLLEYLEATEVVMPDKLAGLMEAIDIYDQNGDGEIDAKDLSEKYGVEATDIEERKEDIERLVRLGKRRIRTQRRRR